MLRGLLAKLNSAARRNRRRRPCETFGRRAICRPTTLPRRSRASIGCRGSALPQLIAAPPLAASFSRRFLRETLVFPVPGRRRHAAGWCSPIRPTSRRCARPRSCSADRSRSRSPPSRISTTVLDQAARRGRRGVADDADEAHRARADDDIESLRDLASGAPVVRAVNDLLETRHGAARDRHPHRAVPHRPRGAHARRRPAARGADAARRAAAGADLAHQDSRRPQHRRAPPAAGRRRARARRRAPSSTSASPPCRRSTANPP